MDTQKVKSWLTRSVTQYVFAFLSGGLITLSLAPFDLWPLGVIAPALLALQLKEKTPKQGFIISWFFGLGLFLSGASWVYVAINDFGMTGIPLAIVMTGMFVAGLAVVFAAPFWLYCRFFSSHQSLFIFPAFWILGEWLRGWLFTGFPWLFIGYGHIDSLLSGWAPILGVFGVGFLASLSGVAVMQGLLSSAPKKKISAILIVLSIWLSGALLSAINWTEQNPEDKFSIAIVQPNIDLFMKWDPRYRPYITEVLMEESSKHWDKDLLIWPEAAVPLMYHDAEAFLSELDGIAKKTQTSFITGILYDQQDPIKYYNSIIGLGLAEGIYFKQRLVPFGEYVPMEKWLRGLIHFFDLPNSLIHPGPPGQEGLKNHLFNIAPFICYEIVYPDLVARNSRDSELLVTISNDAWFGDSIGPIQHLQMTQMRALENGRYIIRATNTGISAVIDHKGNITKAGRQFIQTSFSSEAYRSKNNTPFSLLGSYPIILFCFMILTMAGLYQRKRQQNQSETD